MPLDSPFLHLFRKDLQKLAICSVLSILGGMGIARFHGHHLSGSNSIWLYQPRLERLLASAQNRLELNQEPPSFLSLPRIHHTDLSQKMSLSAPPLLLDARSDLFFQRGHIPGALNLSAEEFVRDYRQLLPMLEKAKAGEIILYCSGNDCEDSKLVAVLLVQLGFYKLSLYEGGWEEWQKLAETNNL